MMHATPSLHDSPTLVRAAQSAARRPAEHTQLRPRALRLLDDHIISEPIASGGMASVHMAVSPDHARPVLAVKKILPHLAREADYTSMLLDEARIASAVKHKNVVTTHGAERVGDEVVLVMDYVAGLSLNVIKRLFPALVIPIRFVVVIMADALRGLHAAHEAASADGAPLGIVHRDVSPQNILCGADGVARVIDFGVAKAQRWHGHTQSGTLKGKIAYMPPEQLRGEVVDRRSDVYSAAVVLWELLVGEGLFHGASELETYGKALRGRPGRPSTRVAGLHPTLDAIVMRGLERRPKDRFATALDMARALDAVAASDPVPREELAEWLNALGADALRKQADQLSELRRSMPARPAKALLSNPFLQSPAPWPQGLSRPRASSRTPDVTGWTLSTLLFVAGLLWGFIVTRNVVPVTTVPELPQTAMVTL